MLHVVGNYMDRAAYFQEIKTVTSPLLLLPNQLETLIQARVNESPVRIDTYLDYADQLSRLDNETAKTRAAFIQMQCSGIHSELFFEKHRDSWGIPKFEEGLLTVEDFNDGFLHTFRDHSTSWCEDVNAREWFYHSVEARFVRHYQFWECDNGAEEIALSASGDYKSIMWTIVKEYQDYSALASSIFTKQELQRFYKNFDGERGDYDKEDLLEIIKENPNW